jgi:hypothetical protein
MSNNLPCFGVPCSTTGGDVGGGGVEAEASLGVIAGGRCRRRRRNVSRNWRMKTNAEFYNIQTRYRPLVLLTAMRDPKLATAEA